METSKKALLANLGSVVRNWPKEAGPRPTSRELSTAQSFYGEKLGTKRWVAAAMYTRKKGATSPEVTAALDGPQLNVWRDVKNSPVPERAAQEKRGKHFAYTLRTEGAPGK